MQGGLYVAFHSVDRDDRDIFIRTLESALARLGQRVTFAEV